MVPILYHLCHGRTWVSGSPFSSSADSPCMMPRTKHFPTRIKHLSSRRSTVGNPFTLKDTDHIALLSSPRKKTQPAIPGDAEPFIERWQASGTKDPQLVSHRNLLVLEILKEGECMHFRISIRPRRSWLPQMPATFRLYGFCEFNNCATRDLQRVRGRSLSTKCNSVPIQEDTEVVVAYVVLIAKHSWG